MLTLRRMLRSSVNFMLGFYVWHIAGNWQVDGQGMDILAFDYLRKFPEKSATRLSVGQCAHHFALLEGVPVPHRCMLSSSEGKVTSHHRPIGSSQNIELRDTSSIFRLVGLCNCEAVSQLGLIFQTDCLAVEIAGYLQFSKKSYTRAYAVHQRSNIDVQKKSETYIPAPLRQKYSQNKFCNYVTYGTLEIIIVQMKFPKKHQIELLRQSKFKPKRMSDWVQHSVKEAGLPKRTKIIRISTSSGNVSLSRYRQREHKEMLRAILIQESQIREITESILRGYLNPHLSYGFSSYITSSRKNHSCDEYWSKVSELQVKVNQVSSSQRKLRKTCKRYPIQGCKTIKQRIRDIRKIQRTLQMQRAVWNTVSHTERTQMIKITKYQLRTFRKQQQILYRQLKKARSQRKS